jgi:hypothetical protein
MLFHPTSPLFGKVFCTIKVKIDHQAPNDASLWVGLRCSMGVLPIIASKNPHELG